MELLCAGLQTNSLHQSEPGGVKAIVKKMNWVHYTPGICMRCNRHILVAAPLPHQTFLISTYFTWAFNTDQAATMDGKDNSGRPGRSQRSVQPPVWLKLRAASAPGLQRLIFNPVYEDERDPTRASQWPSSVNDPNPGPYSYTQQLLGNTVPSAPPSAPLTQNRPLLPSGGPSAIPAVNSLPSQPTAEHHRSSTAVGQLASHGRNYPQPVAITERPGPITQHLQADGSQVPP